jgi:hypothetical protein
MPSSRNEPLRPKQLVSNQSSQLNKEEETADKGHQYAFPIITLTLLSA